MQRVTGVVAAVAICLMYCSDRRGLSEAQELSAQASTCTIAIGQEISKAEQVLRDRGISFSVDSLAIVSSCKDGAHLSFSLDSKQAFAVVFYSRVERTISSISLVFYPEGKPQKSSRSWLEASSVTLEDDGSYSVRFLRSSK
jgi:hypothetical protein